MINGDGDYVYFGQGRSEQSFTPLTYGQFQSLQPEDLIKNLRTTIKQKNASELLAPHVDVLVERFALIPALSHEDALLADGLASQLDRAFACIARSKSGQTIEPNILKKLYAITQEPDFPESQARSSLGVLGFIDAHNQKLGMESIHIIEDYSHGVINKLVHPASPEDFNSGARIVSFTWPFETGLKETLLIEAMRQAPNDDVIRKVYPIFANRLDLEEMRKYLRNYTADHIDFEPVLVRIENAMGFDHSRTVPTISNTYQAIEEKFVHYGPNEELQRFEEKLLKKFFRNNQKILDIGFGPAARHMNALQKIGKHVKGIDVVPSNVQRALKDNPSLDVRVADWHALPFEDGSLDGVYCLGRSALHNTTMDDWLQLLREVHRVLRPTGPNELIPSVKKALIDIPSLSKGNYKNESEEFINTARKNGIYQSERGTIHDSPDSEHYLDRMDITEKQFRTMAKVCGFKARIVSRKPYGDQGDENIYWELTPDGMPMSYLEYVAQYGEELFTKPTITIDVSRKGY